MEKEKVNYRSGKALSAYAAGIQTITIVIACLVYVNQEALKRIFSGPEAIVKVHTVPTVYFAMCICPAVLYFFFLGFQVMAEKKMTGRKTGAILFFALACIMEIALGYLPGFGSLLAGGTGVSEFASYSVLGNIISACTRPFSVAAFGLFALSVGGSL